MQRNVEDRRIVVKSLLNSISVMNIPVNYENTLNIGSAARLRVFCRYCDVVKETEATTLVPLSVMTGWPNQSNSIQYL